AHAEGKGRVTGGCLRPTEARYGVDRRWLASSCSQSRNTPRKITCAASTAIVSAASAVTIPMAIFSPEVALRCRLTGSTMIHWWSDISRSRIMIHLLHVPGGFFVSVAFVRKSCEVPRPDPARDTQALT